ncbi:MAG TPA: ABC-ATPase domain-containing protein [Candidatus Blautia gallistercoris]|uniref:ABC-ATPase domain-containing protein n=1 Tax=Candidatus Blautia gallistercoris TaxID=2838490 RepID=A0A9D2B3I5_9FIRM|nr:ABC-ATPase domain-containing protein [Candidatus Blautia gallistercoris]
MKRAAELRNQLKEIHRRSYPAYKTLRGEYHFGEYILSIDHVQGDPFASPSSLSVRVSLTDAAFPEKYYREPWCRIALQDHLTRLFGKQIQQFSFQARGSGKSGLISVSRCGQEILERTACEITDKDIILRFKVGFPANGRTINAPELEKILFDFLPRSLEQSLWYRNLNKKALEQTWALAQDQAYIRRQLKERNLCAFVADGSILPRQSGVSDLPMKDAIPFSSPDSLRITMDLPHHGPVSGMGISQGITLIVGGGYHGKSTLLQALERGVYSHISGDGREYVITDHSALKLRAEDGRSIRHVDISMFINDLPNKKDTRDFSTPDASGSTSQAANIVEGLEAGTRLFLIDEDTSATNFMVRDTFMQQIISRSKEPITPFLERALDIYRKAGCSTILVAGSSGAFFHIADTVIQMDCYRPVDITAKVREACKDYPIDFQKVPPFVLPDYQRVLQPSRPGKGRQGQPDRTKIKIHDKDSFLIGKESVDLRYVEQLVDQEQTAALACLLKYAMENLADGRRTLREIVSLLETRIRQKGIGSFSDTPYISSGLAVPRIQEIYSCINRYRG